METNSPAGQEPAPADAPALEPAAEGRWSLIALVANDGREPPADLSDRDAVGTWATVSALWHPALLAGARELPRVEAVEYPSPPESGEVRVVAAGASDRLPSGYRTQAADAGTVLLDGDGDADRLGLLTRILGCLDTGGGEADPADPIALDFLALSTARWWLRDLTIAMGHVDCLDAESLRRETLAGARAWRAGDRTTATNRLRAAFELLTQAREKFYPVDSYFVDLCLLDPGAPAGTLADALAAHAPFTLVAPARAIEAQAQRDPQRLAKLLEAINEGWADVAGGTYGEADEPLRPLQSILWQFRRGSETYRKHLGDRNVETLARRRFGLYPQLPQLAKKFGFRFGLHFGLDAGRFPAPLESKRLWEAPDGSYLEALMRLPVPADRPGAGLALPWRIARAMKDDHVATVVLVHWPSPLAGWYLDLRRVVAYSPVLSRWVTLSDYFHLTDRPFEMFRPEPDAYVTPYLAQAVARGDPAPISRRVELTRLRGRLDALACVESLVAILNPSSLGAPEYTSPRLDHPYLQALEDSLESGRLEEARTGLADRESIASRGLARAVAGAEAVGRSGYLVFNPVGVARRAPVLLSEAAADLRPEGPLRAAQFTDEGVWAVADLPAFGYAWIPKETSHELPPAPVGVLGVRDRTMRNELLEVEIDPATGGIRSVRAAGEGSARLGQQLVIAGLVDAQGRAATSKMQAERFEVDYGGPALVQAVSEGRLTDSTGGRLVARFRQRFRLWSGVPVLELEITLTQIDPTWLGQIESADPWNEFLACRWAWPDASSSLSRLCLLTPQPTTAERPETPDAIEIATRRQRTSMLFGGLAHHRRHGPRMLDTILVAGRETCRQFRVGIALDSEELSHAALAFVSEVSVITTQTGPPRTGPAGWFFHVEQKSVVVTRVERAGVAAEGSAPVLVFHLLEAAGRPARVRLRLVRPPVSARQTDFQGDLIADLPVEGDAVLVDLTPHEVARVEVALG